MIITTNTPSRTDTSKSSGSSIIEEMWSNTQQRTKSNFESDTTFSSMSIQQQQQHRNNVFSAVGFFFLVFLLMFHFFTQVKRNLANDYVYGLNVSLYLFHIQFNPNTLKLIKLSSSHSPATTEQHQATGQSESNQPADHTQHEEEVPEETVKTLSFYSNADMDQDNSIDAQQIDKGLSNYEQQRSGYPGVMILPPHLQRPENLEQEIELQERYERENEELSGGGSEEKAIELGYGIPKTMVRNGNGHMHASPRLHHLYFHRERDDDDHMENDKTK